VDSAGGDDEKEGNDFGRRLKSQGEATRYVPKDRDYPPERRDREGEREMNRARERDTERRRRRSDEGVDRDIQVRDSREGLGKRRERDEDEIETAYREGPRDKADLLAGPLRSSRGVPGH
jgi:hypothetical protein